MKRIISIGCSKLLDHKHSHSEKSLIRRLQRRPVLQIPAGACQLQNLPVSAHTKIRVKCR